MGVYMRNKATGEIRDVELDSAEFNELKTQVTAPGLPMWEQTNLPHAEAIRDRAAYGELLPEDLGFEHQDELYEALRVNAEGVSPEANPHLALTPGEVEAGLTPQQKLKDLEEQFEQRVGISRRRKIFDSAADQIADERKERPAAQPAKGQLARAGGSDEREGVPVPEARDEESSGGRSKASKAQSQQQSATTGSQSES